MSPSENQKRKNFDFNILFFQRGKKFFYIFWFLLCEFNGSCECTGLNEMKLLSDAPLVMLWNIKSCSLIGKDILKRHLCKLAFRITFKRSDILTLIDKLVIVETNKSVSSIVNIIKMLASINWMLLLSQALC